MTLTIRPAKVSDAPAILRLLKRSSPEKGRFASAAGYATVQSIRESLQAPKRHTFVAVVRNRHRVHLIGYSVFVPLLKFRFRHSLPIRHFKSSAISVGLVIDPDWRRRGIAVALKKHVFAEAAKRFSRIYSDVRSDNAAAIKVQQRLRMLRIGRFKAPDKTEHLLFEKHLRSKRKTSRIF